MAQQEERERGVAPLAEVRPWQPGDEHGIVALWNEVFGAGVAGFEPRTLDDWRQLYAENPAGMQVIVGVDAEGRIVSHYGALPSRIRIGGRTAIAAQVVDSMVAAGHRRGLQRDGTFLRTARLFYALYSEPTVNAVHYGFPNRRALPIGRRFLGYEPFVAPIPVLHRNFFDTTDDDAIGGSAADALVVEEIARFTPELGALFDRLAPDYPFATVRDLAWLRWRFDSRPGLPLRRFRLVGRDDGALRGWFVVRERWQGQPILALVDLLVAPDDAAAVGAALRAATQLARRTGHARVELWLPERHPTFAAALAAGFRSEPGLFTMVLQLRVEQPSRAEALTQAYYTLADSDIA